MRVLLDLRQIILGEPSYRITKIKVKGGHHSKAVCEMHGMPTLLLKKPPTFQQVVFNLYQTATSSAALGSV